jgi:hypothetical protein
VRDTTTVPVFFFHIPSLTPLHTHIAIRKRVIVPPSERWWRVVARKRLAKVSQSVHCALPGIAYERRCYRTPPPSPPNHVILFFVVGFRTFQLMLHRVETRQETSGAPDTWHTCVCGCSGCGFHTSNKRCRPKDTRRRTKRTSSANCP